MRTPSIVMKPAPGLVRAIGLAWLLAALVLRGEAGRDLLSLEGEWQVADSVSGDKIPADFGHTVRVPGLINQAWPAFPDVDRFLSREYLSNRVRSKLAEPGIMDRYWNGKVEQDRNYFWLRRTFRAPSSPRAVARLRINKAQFGMSVWLNGTKVGDYAGCFSAGLFDLSPAVRWGADNVLLVRIGAHPAVLPDNFPTGSDFEKTKWTPGIYDRVALEFFDHPGIDSVQVAPHLERDEIVVQTKLRNFGTAAVTTDLNHSVRPWKGDGIVARAEPVKVELAPGEERVLTTAIKLPGARHWSPDDPFLYVVDTATAGDSLRTRFGMREFRFRGKQAYLNGQPIFLRGSNITLHRFFEDPQCGDLPWTDSWVRRLLGDLPREMHWNSFRFSIGPVPERWLEICDEEGVLIQNEFPVWTGAPDWFTQVRYSRAHDAAETTRQFADWMRDNWNHPCVVIWDANNETLDPVFGEKVIPAVRPLDLSHRPWENSYNAPVAPNDPVEFHLYLMQQGHRRPLTFKLPDLQTMDGSGPGKALPWPEHAGLVNEYAWLWLHRDGTPTALTENVYAQLLGRDASPRQRLDCWSYLLAAKTEFWRAHRHFAGIMHFVYLTGDHPGAYTSDHFKDLVRLQLDPAFADYVGEAFKPLGVYLNFFEPTLSAGTSREFLVKLVNDHARPIVGEVELTLETKEGVVLARATRPFALDALGAGDVSVALSMPLEAKPSLVLRATARPAAKSGVGPTHSRRWVDLVR